MALINQRILVTGGTGFVGQSVIPLLLAQGAEVVCLTRRQKTSNHPKLKYLFCDLQNKERIQKVLSGLGRVDCVIYMAASIPVAAQARESLSEAMQNNLVPLLNFLEMFGNSFGRIIYTSSVDIYGIPRAVDFGETMPAEPASSYAIAKFCGEKYLEYFCRLQKKTCTILRLSQVYGPEEPLLRVTPFILDAMTHHKEFVLNGSGHDRRRFLNVEDAAGAIQCALESAKEGIFNVAGSEDISLLDAIHTIEKVAGKKLKIKQINIQKPETDILPSFEKARRDLGFNPKVCYEEGIRRILAARGGKDRNGKV